MAAPKGATAPLVPPKAVNDSLFDVVLRYLRGKFYTNKCYTFITTLALPYCYRSIPLRRYTEYIIGGNAPPCVCEVCGHTSSLRDTSPIFKAANL